jgi:hypothetical protein
LADFKNKYPNQPIKNKQVQITAYFLFGMEKTHSTTKNRRTLKKQVNTSVAEFYRQLELNARDGKDREFVAQQFNSGNLQFVSRKILEPRLTERVSRDSTEHILVDVPMAPIIRLKPQALEPEHDATPHVQETPAALLSPLPNIIGVQSSQNPENSSPQVDIDEFLNFGVLLESTALGPVVGEPQRNSQNNDHEIAPRNMSESVLEVDEDSQQSGVGERRQKIREKTPQQILVGIIKNLEDIVDQKTLPDSLVTFMGTHEYDTDLEFIDKYCEYYLSHHRVWTSNVFGLKSFIKQNLQPLYSEKLRGELKDLLRTRAILSGPESLKAACLAMMGLSTLWSPSENNIRQTADVMWNARPPMLSNLNQLGRFVICAIRCISSKNKLPQWVLPLKSTTKVVRDLILLIQATLITAHKWMLDPFKRIYLADEIDATYVNQGGSRHKLQVLIDTAKSCHKRQSDIRSFFSGDVIEIE